MIPPKPLNPPQKPGTKEVQSRFDDTSRTSSSNTNTGYLKEMETMRLIEEQKAELHKQKLEENLRQMKETIKQSQLSLNLTNTSQISAQSKGKPSDGGNFY